MNAETMSTRMQPDVRVARPAGQVVAMTIILVPVRMNEGF